MASTWLRKLLRMAFFAAMILLPMVLGAGYVIVTRLSADLPDVAGLASYEPPQTSRIFSRDGQVVATMFVENRTAVPLDRMSPYLPKALLAVEDSRFMQHHGVDWVGVARAAVANVVFRGIDQGASTLTMQLARNRFLTQDQTLARKIREIVLALRIERKFSKEKILEYYLNNVYFGSGAYGVAAASSLYFGRPVQQLTIAQSALIAGLVQAPSRLSPLVDAPAAIHRMKVVLGRMVDTGIITSAQYREAMAEGEAFRFGHGGTALSSGDQLLKYPYFTTFVMAELGERYAEDVLYRGGLQIHSTLDVDLQRAAEEELQALLAESGAAQNASNAALVLIENASGNIRAMVGGVGWSQENQFNRAWQAQRQPGSSFKAFVYAAALLAGKTPESVEDDSPVQFGDWSPKNSDGKFKGPIPLRQALQESRNVIAAKLCAEVGPEKVIQVARMLGVRESLTPNLTVALGACEVSPLSMASAYSTLASGGLYRPPLSVSRILDSSGSVLTDNRQLTGRQVVVPEVAAQLTEMLMGAVLYGTGRAADLPGLDVAGKTGTTDDSRDAWFVGFTPDYTLACWVGNDDHSAMQDVYGGGLPALLWHRVMERVAARGVTKARFDFESKGQVVRICAESGFPASALCRKLREQRVRTSAPLDKVCPLHSTSVPTSTPTPVPTPVGESETEAESDESELTPTPVIGEAITPTPYDSADLPVEMTPLP